MQEIACRVPSFVRLLPPGSFQDLLLNGFSFESSESSEDSPMASRNPQNQPSHSCALCRWSKMEGHPVYTLHIRQQPCRHNDSSLSLPTFRIEATWTFKLCKMMSFQALFRSFGPLHTFGVQALFTNNKAVPHTGAISEFLSFIPAKLGLVHVRSI